jgi:hypothetical protein
MPNSVRVPSRRLDLKLDICWIRDIGEKVSYLLTYRCPSCTLAAASVQEGHLFYRYCLFLISSQPPTTSTPVDCLQYLCVDNKAVLLYACFASIQENRLDLSMRKVNTFADWPASTIPPSQMGRIP